MEAASAQADGADAELAAVDGDVAARLSSMPNLLDDQVPPGSGDHENELVHEWGADQRKVGPPVARRG